MGKEGAQLAEAHTSGTQQRNVPSGNRAPQSQGPARCRCVCMHTHSALAEELCCSLSLLVTPSRARCSSLEAQGWSLIAVSGSAGGRDAMALHSRWTRQGVGCGGLLNRSQLCQLEAQPLRVWCCCSLRIQHVSKRCSMSPSSLCITIVLEPKQLTYCRWNKTWGWEWLVINSEEEEGQLCSWT